MRISMVTVSSMQKLPHPDADYASTSEMVTLQAEISEGDSVSACVKKLQAQADGLVETYMETKTARLKLKAASAKPKVATESTAVWLAAKHEPF